MKNYAATHLLKIVNAKPTKGGCYGTGLRRTQKKHKLSSKYSLILKEL